MDEQTGIVLGYAGTRATTSGPLLPANEILTGKGTATNDDSVKAWYDWFEH